MIDIVIPLGKGSTWQDNELRICLRAIEQHLTNYRNIWIVGEYPKWLQHCYHIPLQDKQKLIPDKNIMLKIKAACEEKEISDTFLFMNDDHFLLSNYDAETFPYYWDIYLGKAYELRGDSPYGRRIRNTLESLLTESVTLFHYDTHYPIVYNKQNFIERVVNPVDWEVNKYGYIIKSLYANYEPMNKAIRIHDCKSNEIPRDGWKCYSTMPHLSEGVKQYLFRRFPNKSKYEK